MIPLIRSIQELRVITQSKDEMIKKNKYQSYSEDREKIKRKISSGNENRIYLPYIPKEKRLKWIRSKEALSKFFDGLDYNNQIRSTYDLINIENQTNYNHHDAA